MSNEDNYINWGNSIVIRSVRVNDPGIREWASGKRGKKQMHHPWGLMMRYLGPRGQ